ncbi:hypothetical protein GGI04_004020 [Coemansia thaxteri]|nr:hypothetical protein GGI04_004020 [Coemansia thaxteri]
MKAKDDGDSATTAASDKKAAAAEAFEELLKQYDTKIDALRKARDALKTAPPASPPADGGSDDAAGGVRWSRALLTIELFCEMIDDIMMDVVFETHFEAKQCASVCAVCNTRCQSDAALAEAAAADGPSSQPAAPDLFECPCCQRPYPAARFASHMDKCMGLSSRRAATRRSKQ